MEKTKQLIRERHEITLARLADAHCHLYELDRSAITAARMAGVRIMITNGVDTRTNARTLEMYGQDGIYCMVGVHPNSAITIEEDELEFNVKLIKANAKKIVGIGEIGLDYLSAKDDVQKGKQKRALTSMLDLAAGLRKPVSLHSRGSIKDVFKMLESYPELPVHMHFFEGSAEDARLAQKRGYYISVPYLKSAQRAEAVRAMELSNIMVESDSPTANSTPSDVLNAVQLVSELKGIEKNKVAEQTFENTKRLFNIDATRFMRSGL